MPQGYEVQDANGQRAWWDGKKLTPLDQRGLPQKPGGRLTAQEEKQLTEARDSANMFSEVARQASEFGKMNTRTPTGPIYKIPGAKTIGGFFDPNISRMEALTARMAPQQRVPGSGTTSDRDLALFLKAVPDVERMGGGNAGVEGDMNAMAERRRQRAYFLDRYAQQNGTLKGGEEAFAASWAKRSRPKAPPAPARARYLGTE